MMIMIMISVMVADSVDQIQLTADGKNGRKERKKNIYNERLFKDRSQYRQLEDGSCKKRGFRKTQKKEKNAQVLSCTHKNKKEKQKLPNTKGKKKEK